MPKKSYGKTVETRVKCLFEALLDHVERGRYEENDREVKFNSENGGRVLRFETNLAALEGLMKQNGYKGTLTKDQVREAIELMRDHLKILTDERLPKKGSKDWKFSLNLWATYGDKKTNLVKFSEEWHKKRSEPSKKAVTKTEEAPQPTPSPVATTAVMNTTPPPVNEWRGRQAEMRELQTALGDENRRLIGITAAGGYGKSALAAKLILIDRIAADWRILWVTFSQAYGLAQFGRWLLEQLEQPYDEKWDEGTLIQQMIRGLSAERCLLVLDNLETVVTAEGDSVYRQFLSQWLATGRNSKVLFTSREQPKFAANLLRPALRFPYHRCPLKGLEEADAIRLVTEDYGLEGTEAELAQFVKKMGRHPLLIQLVCSLMVERFVVEIPVTRAVELGLDLFAVPGYHRDTETCVGEVVAASLARSPERLRDVLTRLSVLREAFDLSLARGIVGEVTEEELRHLVRLSLLQESPPSSGKPRTFQFLPLIQMIVQQRSSSEVLQEAHRSALAYFSEHFPAPPWESLTDLTAYLEAFYHAGELGEWQLAHALLNKKRGGEGKNKSVEEFLDLQGFYHQRAQLYEQVIAGSQREQDCHRNSLNLLGLCYHSLGQYEEAITHHQQCHDISEEMGDREGVAISLGNLGNCYGPLGQYEKAIAYHQQYHDISEEIDSRRGVALSLCGLGNCYCSLGQYEKAIAYYQQYHDISGEIGEQRGVAISLGNLGSCYDSLGQYEKAIAHHQQYHDISEEIGDREGMALALNNIGIALFQIDNYSEAETKIQESLVISQEINAQYLIVHSLKALAEIARETNRPDLALNYCQQALILSEQLGIPLAKNCEELLAKIQDNLGEIDE